MNGFTPEQLENIKKTGRSGFLGGEFFHTGYYHTGCDDELMGRCKSIGKYFWCERAKVYHDHPIQGNVPNDEIYQYAYSSENLSHDRRLLEERSKLLGFEVRHDFFEPIPKKIFTIWLNDKEMPEDIKKSIETHKLEGYEHKLITLENCYHNKYIDDCLSKHDTKGWVKAADYLRIHELYKSGGIYLDADTTVLKPFDDLLDTKMFVCKEDNGFIANGIIGVVPFHPTLKAFMDKVERLDGKDDKVFENGMEIWTPLIYEAESRNEAKVYTQEYFLPYNHQTGVTNITNNTYTTHAYLKSWVSLENKSKLCYNKDK